MVSEGEGYKVVDLDSNSEYPTMAKESLAVNNTPDIENNYAAVDAYFEEVNRKTDRITEWKADDFAELVEEEEEFPQGQVFLLMHGKRSFGVTN
jgi:hypothetical protein